MLSGLYRNFCFFQLWCEACSFSKIFSRKSTLLCFFEPYCHFSWFFRNKKDAQRNLATNDVYKSPWSPVIDHLVQFWIMSVQNNPRLSWSLFGFDEALVLLFWALKQEGIVCVCVWLFVTLIVCLYVFCGEPFLQ